MPVRRRWLVAAATGVVVLALSFLVDYAVERWVTAHRGASATSFFRAATHLGDPSTAFVIGLLAALFAAFRSARTAMCIVAVTILRPLLSTAAKDLVGRKRPHLSQLVKAGGDSFPSGHTLAATVAWGCVPAALIAWRIGRDVVRAVTIAMAVVVLAVATSRVYLGVHWVSDVIGGALLGALLLCVVYVPLRRN